MEITNKPAERRIESIPVGIMKDNETKGMVLVDKKPNNDDPFNNDDEEDVK